MTPRAFAFSLLQFCYSMFTNVTAIPSHLVWMLLLTPLRLFSWSSDIYWACEAVLFNGLLSMVTGWFKSAGYSVIEAGDDIDVLCDKRVLLMSNHQSTSDVPSVMAVIHLLPDVGGHSYWIMDHIFRYTHFGAVSMLRGDFFIRQGKEHRAEELVRFREHLMTTYFDTRKNWIILFPEGGFLRKRREASQRFARKNNLPVLQHVSLPRTGAMQVIFDSLPPSPYMNHAQNTAEIEWVVDLTIAYPDGKPLDLIDVLCATHAPCQLIYYYRAYPAAEVPRDVDTLAAWMYERYAEKDEMLARYYASGKFPFEHGRPRTLPTATPRSRETSWLRLIGYHAFFTLSTYLHFTYVYRPLWNFIF